MNVSVSLPSSSARLGPAHRWRVLAAGVAANLSFSAAAAGIPTTAVWLRAAYRLDNHALGVVLGALGLGVALLELPWGIAADRFGDRRVLLTGLVATAALLAAMALAIVPSANGVPPLARVAAAMMAVGLFGGSVNGSSGRAVMRWFGERERGLAMSIRQTAVPLGGGVGAALLPWLASHAGFAAVYAALALLCAASAGLTWRWLHEPPASEAVAAPAHPHGPRGAAGQGPLTRVEVWKIVFGIGLLCAPQFAVLTFATVFLHDVGRLGIAGISATMVVIQLGAMVMRVWSGRRTDRLGNRRGWLRRAVLIAAASFALLAAATAASRYLPFASIVVLLAVAGICVSAWHGVAYTELATLAGTDHAGTALGMANTVVYLGLFATPIAIPFMLAHAQWSVVWFAAAVCAWATWPLFPRPQATGRKPMA
ncbi:sugar phosphate permease [Paraburkholderia caballeronis]|uniref:MFS transporter n=1 Tax=Paraburkholderia caballeronis TaxID=416943 RepID=UPI001066844E|nr:MFS transporter [Paraburkholderia caballeronis]TDV33953.1 sugar phosphate permease [Paraburkholderia caballeronis]